MITAMPEVKPVMTGMGMNAVSLPSLKQAASTISTPARNVATNMPFRPYWLTTPISTAAMAPVGPEI